MNARLVCVAGPAKGTVFELVKQEVSIGRERANGLVIEEPWLSRRHCVVEYANGGYVLRDLNSRNGTFVNGLPVERRVLQEGDQIRMGESVILFTTGGAAYEPVQFEEPSLARETVLLRREDSNYLRPAALAEPAEESARVAGDLKALLGVAAAISSTSGLEELQRQLLESLFAIVPAQRGAILLVEEGSLEPAAVLSLDRQSGRTVPVSRTVIARVLGERVSILSNDVLDDATRSLAAIRVTSLLAVPLLFLEKLLGAIYLNTSNPLARFDQDHLHLVTGIAAIAAPALANAQRLTALESENRRLQAQIDIAHDMIGDSPRMREVYQFIGKAAPTASTVLITGESGTGKELVARAIHRNSPRAGKPFVAINCAAIAETLLESELFGHEKGAFTGAIAQKRGKLEEANGGTVFLDEIGELAPALQAKLLRVLQEREFERVGGTRPVRTDIRLLAATNRDLQEAVKAGQFRQDLFYRLNVVSVKLPPLRERRQDIPVLARHFAEKHCRLSNRAAMEVSESARACLLSYDWPGNVRELENAIERAVVLGSSSAILPEDLPESVLETERSGSASPTRFHEAVHEAKRQIVLKALDQAGGNHNEAARLLGLHPNNLHRLIRSLGLRAAKA